MHLFIRKTAVYYYKMGTKITPIERKFMDTKVFEAEKNHPRTRVASVYNMPAHMLGETEGASYSSMEQMALEYVQNTLTPIVTQYEKGIQSQATDGRGQTAGNVFQV